MPQTARIAPPAPISARRDAQFQPTSFSQADNSIEVVWTTGAIVTRFDFRDYEYFDEQLSTSADAVRLDRLNAGAAVLDNHRTGSCGAVVGSIVPGSARMTANQGVCRVRLAETPDVADIVAKVKAGHIRSVSVGYAVHVFQRTERAGERPLMLATDWEPQEISFVTVPADPGALIRSETTLPHPQHERSSSNVGDTPAPLMTAQVSSRFVREKCRSLGINDADTDKLIDIYTDPEEPYSRGEFLDAIVTWVGNRRGAGTMSAEGDMRDSASLYAASRALPCINSAITEASGRSQGAQAHVPGSPEHLRQRMSGAILARMAGGTPPPESAEFMSASMIDMMRGLLTARGERATWMSPAEVYARHGAMTTSDFSLLLGNATGQFVNQLLVQNPSTMMRVAKSRTTRDFKPITSLTLEGGASLDLLLENAEYTYAAMGENGVSYRVSTFGKMFSLSRQAIINDSLGAFAQLAINFVRAGAAKRADFLAAIVNSNLGMPRMGDNSLVPLFDASRGNLAAIGAGITVASLSAGRLAMRSQKDKDDTILGVTPKFLVVPPARETEAEAALTEIAASSTANANPFAGKLELLVDDRLAPSAWYLFADPSLYPVLEYATIEGQPEIYTETRQSWNPDGTETKARMDYGAAAVDAHGAYKNPGN